MYAFNENFVLPLSHDEVVHGKGSLLAKMPGDRWQQFANLRAYYGFMCGHPGKKLLFMGGEFAQEREWNHDRSLDWHLLAGPGARRRAALVRDLNRLYRSHAGAARADFERRRLRVDRRTTTPSTRAEPSCAAAGKARDADAGRVQLHAGAARPGCRVGVPRGRALARAAQHRLRALRRQQRRQRRSARWPIAARGLRTAARSRSRSTCRRWRRSMFECRRLTPHVHATAAARPALARWAPRSTTTGVNFARLLGPRQRDRAVPVRRHRRSETARLALPARSGDVWHGHLPGAGAGPRLRPARARPVAPRAGPPLQPAQAAARPVRARDRRPLRLAATSTSATEAGHPDAASALDARDNGTHRAEGARRARPLRPAARRTAADAAAPTPCSTSCT